MSERIYLDNAATSWPKPEGVYEAVDDYQRRLGAPAGRGAYSSAGEVERLIAQARLRLARLIGAREPRQIIFTQNGTDSLNLALHGLLGHGDHVVTTTVEHNSVLRPLRWLEQHQGVEVTRVDCDSRGFVTEKEIAAQMRSSTRLVALTHASNVVGTLQPVEEVAEMTRDRRTLLLIDAAQTVGHLPLHVGELQCDLLAAPGHKGLLGPLGTGFLYIGRRAEPHLDSVRQGGTGSQSESDSQVETLPDKFESGNLNAPGLIGLGAALEYVEQRGIDDIRQHEMELTAQCVEGLADVPGVTVYGQATAILRAGVVSFAIDGLDPQEVAISLDAACGVQVRAGFHCAPLVHQAIGTFDGGGTVRISPGPFTTADQMQTAITAIGELAAASVA